KQKVREGVEVRVMYDDMGCISTLKTGYWRTLEQFGIKARVFNEFKPSLDMFMNNRDHRKIAVIDGNVGFTGGINLADEYINEYAKHGYWKDASVVLRGEAVFNLTIIFLRLWGLNSPDYNEDIFQFKPTEFYPSKGYVFPFDDSPLDNEQVGELTYMSLINNAKHYIYITTPYLIIDNEMTVSLKLAAKSGVDVRIVTPFFADKWFVHAVTRSSYNELIEAGIKIFEFTPGFIHSKTIVCDDEIALVGTTNFDYRSFYLHFECGCLMYKTSAIMQIKADYEDILSKSTPIQITKPKFFVGILRAVLKIFAPLM
ncbi:MAG: phospholipase D-like domain-containing protein, partial [Niameybacter sp.]